jgi:hypothetical protein
LLSDFHNFFDSWQWLQPQSPTKFILHYSICHTGNSIYHVITLTSYYVTEKSLFSEIPYLIAASEFWCWQQLTFSARNFESSRSCASI